MSPYVPNIGTSACPVPTFTLGTYYQTCPRKMDMSRTCRDMSSSVSLSMTLVRDGNKGHSQLR